MSSRRSARAYVWAVLLLGGASVLVVEILGSRLLAPVFGGTLYVWAAMITVALGALAVGYLTGGLLADRRPDLTALGAVLVAAGVALAVPVAARSSLLQLAEPFGVQTGPMVAASLLFGPSLLALGMVSPAALRLLTDDVDTVGRVGGRVFGVSTVGSLLGALVAVFVLLRVWFTAQILAGTAGLLVVLGLAGLVGSRAWRSASAAALVASASGAASTLAAPAPREGALLYQAESAYGLVEVVAYEDDAVRFLTVDGIGQSSRDQRLRDRSSYIARMGLPIAHLRPGARVLVLGLGAGQLLVDHDRDDLVWDLVELNPQVLDAAQRHLGLALDPARHTVHATDARAFLRHAAPAAYDLVLVDVFQGMNVPDHLLTWQALAELAAVVAPGGSAAVHVVGRTDGTDPFTDRLVATARTAFASVLVGGGRPDAYAPVVLMLSNGGLSLGALNDDVDELRTVYRSTMTPFTAWSGPGAAPFEDGRAEAAWLWLARSAHLQRAYRHGGG